jgi:trimeric autotransporter adhesin
MAITLVGTPVVNSTASGAVTFTKTIAAGNSLILCLNVYDSSGTSPMTVSVTGGGGTWASVVLATANAFTSRSQIWRCFNPSAGSQTITVTPTTIGDTVIGCLAEFSPLLAGSVTLGTSSSFTTTPTIGPTSATTNAVELVIATLAAFTQSNGGTSPATTGYTNLGNQVSPNGTIRADYKVTSSTGTQSAAWGTFTAGDTQNATIATFLDNSGPSGNSDGWPLAGMVAVGRLLAGGGGGGITASLAKTDGADTFAGSAALSLTASLATTDSTDTFAASAALSLSASIAFTDGADTFAGSSSLAISSSLATTDGADVFAGSAALSLTASLSTTDGADVFAGTADPGSASITASLATTDGADVFTGNAALSITSSVTFTDGVDTFAGNASLAISASLATTDGADIFSGTGTLSLSASISTTDGADTFAGTAALSLTASLGTTDGADVFAGIADPTGSSFISSTDGADVFSGTAALSLTGSVSVTDGADTFAANGDLSITASIGATDGADVFTGNADTNPTITASIAATDGADTFTGLADTGVADQPRGSAQGRWNPIDTSGHKTSEARLEAARVALGLKPNIKPAAKKAIVKPERIAQAARVLSDSAQHLDDIEGDLTIALQLQGIVLDQLAHHAIRAEIMRMKAEEEVAIATILALVESDVI